MPLGVYPHARRNPVERFWAKVDKSNLTGCWLWTAYRNKLGYGQFYDGVRLVPAHRFSYELVNGPLEPGKVSDHLCRNPGCVNPDHVEPVTRGENVLRGYSLSALNSRKTHCSKGHALSRDNLYVTPSGNRQCKTCRAIWQTKHGLRTQPEEIDRAPRLVHQCTELTVENIRLRAQLASQNRP